MYIRPQFCMEYLADTYVPKQRSLNFWVLWMSFLSFPLPWKVGFCDQRNDLLFYPERWFSEKDNKLEFLMYKIFLLLYFLLNTTKKIILIKWNTVMYTEKNVRVLAMSQAYIFLISCYPPITIRDANKMSDLRAFSGSGEPSVAGFTILILLAHTHRSDYSTALPNHCVHGRGQFWVAVFQFFRNN